MGAVGFALVWLFLALFLFLSTMAILGEFRPFRRRSLDDDSTYGADEGDQSLRG